jgi:glutamate carboxypeptidase
MDGENGDRCAPERVFEWFAARTNAMVETVRDFAGMDTPSGDAEALAGFAAAYERLLTAAGGLSVRHIPGPRGPHLFAERKAAASTRPPIVLVGHADTVWPRGEAARRPPGVEGDRLLGPGVYDMKAGLALIAYALRYLSEQAPAFGRAVQVFVAADEELGGTAAHPEMEKLLPPDAIALVLEPPCEDGSLKAWRKGVGMYELEVAGREAHAGNEPERGTNAIVELAKLILEVSSWSDPARGVSVNVGTARGGVATNVIAGRASAGVDTRFERPTDGEEIDRRLRALQPSDSRASLTVKGGIIFPPLAPDTRSERLHAIAIGAAAELGLAIGRGKSGGGSDGSFLASRGLAVADGLGVEGGGAHAREEHILIERLPARAAFLARLILALEEEDL